MSEVTIKLDRQTADDALEVILLCLEQDKQNEFLNGHSIDVLRGLAIAIGKAFGVEPPFA